MELRSRRQKREANEYAELKITLTGLGFYEDNMPLMEMREILQALQMSEYDVEKDDQVSEQNSECMRSIEKPLSLKQEPEFAFTNGENVLSSTMINRASQMDFSSPCSSPEPPFEILIVQALVHHPLNWSPSRGNSTLDNVYNDHEGSFLTRKRNATEESSSTPVKRLCLDSIENAPDSGINLSEPTSSNPSPVSKVNLEEESLSTAAHSTRQMHSGFYSGLEDIIGRAPSRNIFPVSDEVE